MLICNYGSNAALVAAQHADASLNEGDIEARRVCIAPATTIGKLLRTKPNEGEQVN